MQMVSKKDLQLSSTTGVAIAFAGGVPRNVPECLRAEAIMAGCMPVLEQGEVNDEPKLSPADVAAANAAATAAGNTAAFRSDLIQNAIKELIAKNDETKFKNDGSPRVDAVRAIVGEENVTAEEVASAFILVNAAE